MCSKAVRQNRHTTHITSDLSESLEPEINLKSDHVDEKSFSLMTVIHFPLVSFSLTVCSFERSGSMKVGVRKLMCTKIKCCEN